MRFVRVRRGRISVRSSNGSITPYFAGTRVALKEDDYVRLVACGAVEDDEQLPEGPRRPGPPRVWLVTPVWRRPELTAVCLEQHARLTDVLAARHPGPPEGALPPAGWPKIVAAPPQVELHRVVVGDSQNVKAAAGLGADTILLDNNGLGRKFNAGIEYACEHDADFVCPVGSDTWLGADLFDRLPAVGEVRCVRRYWMVPTGGRRIFAAQPPWEGGTGSRLIPRALLARTGFRPARDDLMRGVDTSILSSLQATGPVKLRFGRDRPMTVVGFESAVQLHGSRELAEYEVAAYDDPWARLATRYPTDLVDRAERLCRREAPALA